MSLHLFSNGALSVSFYIVILPRHVEGDKLDKTVWNLCTFHAYVSYHIKVSKHLEVYYHAI